MLDVAPDEPVAFFTGAGVSAGAGLPTYRGTGGIYTTGLASPLSARHATVDSVHLVWEHLNRLGGIDLRPAPAHLAISRFAANRPGRVTVVTQNVDGLHEASALSQSSPETIYALHGTTATATCLSSACSHRGSPRDWVRRDDGVPLCPACGGPTRPDVVLFGEMLDSKVFSAATAAVRSCAVLVVVGTSLEVTPAANIAVGAAYEGTPIHWVNPSPPPPSVEGGDSFTDHRDTADNVLPSLLADQR